MTEFSRKYPLVKVVLLVVLSMFAYDTLPQRSARAAVASPAAALQLAQQTWHIADAGRDVGPGDSEPLLARLP